MELAIALSPEDCRALTGSEGGFAYSGSYAGRNIEKIYSLGNLEGSLQAAVQACFLGSSQPKHVLVVSGFYVLHNRGGNPGTEPGVAAGSCETDGPLGALALVRAFAARGVRASLFCDRHNGPVLRAGYEAMLQHYDEAGSEMAAQLRSHSRCLPFVADLPAPGEDDGAAFASDYARAFGGEATAPPPEALRARAVRCARGVGAAVRTAWGEEAAAAGIDCLFALERLGAPYRNIRGRDIGEHTEPIDALWPLAAPPQASAAARRIGAWVDGGGVGGGATAALRQLAGVRPDPLTLAIGDGGNEVRE
jgi:hypothetical protein